MFYFDTIGTRRREVEDYVTNVCSPERLLGICSSTKYTNHRRDFSPRRSILSGGPSIVVVSKDECEERVLLNPHPFWNLQGDRIHQSCAWQELDLTPGHTEGNGKKALERTLSFVVDRIILRILDHSRGISQQEKSRVIEIGLEIALDFLSAERTNEHDNPLSGVSLVLLPEQKIIPIGMLSRRELVQMLQEAPLASRMKRAASDILQNTTLIASDKHSWGSWYAESLSSEFKCLQAHQARDLIVSPWCSRALDAAAVKMNELEVYWDAPLAAIVRWVYIILGVAAILTLQADLGHGETTLQRKRRQFRQILEDPVLRRNIKVLAEKEMGEDAVAAYMADLDARAARYSEEAQADDEWKRQEAKLVAWKARIATMWAVRKILALLFVFSLVLFCIDQPQAGTVLEGLMVLVLVFFGTYVCLPTSPQRQAKKLAESEQPLLSNFSGNERPDKVQTV